MDLLRRLAKVLETTIEDMALEGLKSHAATWLEDGIGESLGLPFSRSYGWVFEDRKPNE